jgi:hypothetical protein
LRIGRRDLSLKAIFARLDKDPLILALPDRFVDVLPKNRFAFRDHTVLTASPAQISKLEITRAGRTDVLEPNKTGEPNQWRMRRPIDAPADTRSVTQAIAVLARLRADDFVSETIGDPKKYGLDRPLLEVAWESDRTNRLKVGAQVPRSPSYYAVLEGEPYLFTLLGETLKPFEAEFRDHVVMSFPLASAERIVLHWGWPKRTVAIYHRSPAPKGQPEWVETPGTDARGIDLSAAAALVKALSRLETVRFAQYEGDIPIFTGLTRPRLVVEVVLSGNQPARFLRIGSWSASNLIFAAEGIASFGPVFLLPSAAWDALIQSGERFDPLPDPLFAPAP